MKELFTKRELEIIENCIDKQLEENGKLQEARKHKECADAILEVMTPKEATEFIKYMGW
jgi:hypothetical protein